MRSVYVCADCTTSYAIKLTKCPRCNGMQLTEDRNGMAKITRHEGPSNVAETGVPDPDSGVDESTSEVDTPPMAESVDTSSPTESMGVVPVAETEKQAPIPTQSARRRRGSF